MVGTVENWKLCHILVGLALVKAGSAQHCYFIYSTKDKIQT
jgi:hypothetical protein